MEFSDEEKRYPMLKDNVDKVWVYRLYVLN
jgi:hypothetical protein